MYGTDIQRYIIHQSQDKEAMHKRNQHKERCQIMSGRFCQSTELSSGAEKNISGNRVANNDRVILNSFGS